MKQSFFISFLALLLIASTVMGSFVTYQKVKLKSTELTLDIEVETSDSEESETSKTEENIKEEAKVYEAFCFNIYTIKLLVSHDLSFTYSSFTSPHLKVLTPPPNTI